MREKDDMLQIDFGAPRCSIWVQQMSGTGRHQSALVGIVWYWKMGITGGVGPGRDRGRLGGDCGETKGRQGVQHYQQFLIIAQLVAGKH